MSAFLQENLEESERQRVGCFYLRIIINVQVPVVYMRRDVPNVSDAGNVHEGHWKVWALNWQRAKRVPFGRYF